MRPRRLAGARSIAEARAVFEAGPTALAHHRWLTAPAPDQEGEIRDALQVLHAGGATGVPPLDATRRAWHWLDRGGGVRPPLRAALLRFWEGDRQPAHRPAAAHRGDRAARGPGPWSPAGWRPALLHALADEADDTLDLLLDLERGWSAARRAVAGRHRRHARTPAAVDLLAAVPLLSATTLAGALDISIKSALEILDGLLRAGVAVEVTGRAARRLFGLRGLAPLAAAVAPPRRPEPGRGRGRPRRAPPAEAAEPPPPLAPPGPVERRAFDYGDLDAAMAAVEEAVRRARRNLDALAGRGAASASDLPDPEGDASDGADARRVPPSDR
jgi:hypothetical protein